MAKKNELTLKDTLPEGWCDMPIKQRMTWLGISPSDFDVLFKMGDLVSYSQNLGYTQGIAAAAEMMSARAGNLFMARRDAEAHEFRSAGDDLMKLAHNLGSAWDEEQRPKDQKLHDQYRNLIDKIELIFFI